MVQYTHRPAHRAQAQKGKQMAAVQVYEVEEFAGTQYVTTEARGVRYTLSNSSGQWVVWTRRQGYGGRFHTGGCQIFSSLREVADKCRAFADFYGMEAA